MNAKEISAQRFDKSAFGYKVDEVDAYLNEVAAVVNELTVQNTELQKKLEILATKLEEYRQDENSMKEALIGAQKLGNNILKEAREKADEIIKEAQEKGDTIIREATENSQKTLASVKKDIEKEQHTLLLTQREVSNFKSKLLALYKSHLDTITSIPELKEKDSDAVESISSKLTESESIEVETAPAVERAASQSQTPDSEAAPMVATAEKPAETPVPPIFSSRFGPSSGLNEEQRSSMESKFGELRFGRNAKK
jgi:cell division initiation protein